MRRKATAFVRTAGGVLLRSTAARRAVLSRAAATARCLALVYHRVRPAGPAPYEVVPTLPSAILREQLELLAGIGDIVPLSALYEQPASRQRVRFGISFDDDEPSHVAHVLPLLRALGVTATFFLSGRELHGLGPYWWHCLEALIRDGGFDSACRSLGIAASSPAQLAARCEGSPITERICAMAPTHDAPGLDAAAIRALAASGMSIGFHTLLHPLLTTLPPAELETTLHRGRADLAAAAGGPVSLLAYPFGRTNRAAAAGAEAAGFSAAFASGGYPIAPHSHRFCLGRWEPNALRGERFLAAIALRLMRPADVQPG